MKKSPIRYFALSIVFLAVALVFYSQTDLGIAKFLIFFLSGIVCGISLMKGMFVSHKNKE